MNRERWKHLDLGADDLTSMDWRHVLMVNSVLESEKPATVVEIGCYRGCSTTAIIEASEKKDFEWVDCVDINFHKDFHADLPGNFRKVQMDSRGYAPRPECWIIDGEHEGIADGDYDRALAAKARIIIIHDSNYAQYTPGRGHCHGAVRIAGRLRSDATYYFEDCRKRDGEATDRGLLIGFFFPVNIDTIVPLKRLADLTKEQILTA